MPSPIKLKGIWYNVEDNGFGVAPSSDTFPTNYTWIGFAEDIEITPDAEHLPVPHQQPRFFNERRTRGTESTATVSFKVAAHGWNVGQPSGAPTTTPPLGQLIRSSYHTESKGGKTTVAGSGSTTKLVEVASNTTFAEGQVIGVETAAGLEYTVINIIDSTSFYVSPELAGIPTATTGDVFGCFTYVPRDALEANQSIKFVAVGYDTEARYDLVGCRGTSVKRTVNHKQVTMFEFEFAVQAWSQTTHSQVTPATYAYPQPKAAIADTFLYSASADYDSGAKSTPTNLTPALNTEIHVASCAFDSGLEVAGQPSLTAAQGVAEWILTGRSATITIQPSHYDVDYFTDSAAVARKSIMQWDGTTAGNITGVVFPSAQFMSEPKEADVDGILGLDLEFEEGLVYDYTNNIWLEGASGDSEQWPANDPQNAPYKLFIG